MKQSKKNPLVLPKLPEHLQMRFLSAWDFQRNFSKYKKTVQRLSDKWDRGSLKSEKERFAFLKSVNGLIVIARQNGIIAKEALNFLLGIMDIHIKRAVQAFLRKRENLNREERERKRENKNLNMEVNVADKGRKDTDIADPEAWYVRAWRITRTYIISDQTKKYSRKKEIEQYFEDNTALEEKHLSLVDRNLRQRFLFLMENFECYDPEMKEIIKSLACRGREDIFRFFSAESLEEKGLSGGLGYDPFYLEPKQIELLDDYKIIDSYFSCFNDGDFPGYDEHSLKVHIEKEIGTSIDEVLDGIKAIPDNPYNFFSYMFSLDNNGFSKLTSKLDQLNELLNDHAPPIYEDTIQYDFLAEGHLIQDKENDKADSRNIQVSKTTEYEKENDILDIFTEIKQILTPRRAEILETMIDCEQQVNLVAKKMNVSPAYISKEFSIIKKTISTNAHLKDLVSDLW